MEGRNFDWSVCFFGLGPVGRFTVGFAGWLGLFALARYWAQSSPRLSATGQEMVFGCSLVAACCYPEVGVLYGLKFLDVVV